MAEDKVVAAHEQKQTIHITEYYPSHLPRSNDPHYHLFNQSKERLKKMGKYVCWVNNKDCGGQLELHHNLVEYSLANGVDIKKFSEAFPELHIENDEDFLQAIESEGGLLVLCSYHHIGFGGIHLLPYPLFSIQKYWKDDTPIPAKVTEGDNK